MKFSSFGTALNSKVKLKLLRLLLHNYSPMGERELARVAGVSYMSVHLLLREFSELDLVYPTRMGNVMVWRVNERSLAFRELKKAVESILSMEDPLKHLIKTLQAKLSKLPVEEATIFGSVAQRTERPSSDIDLFVLVKDRWTKKQVIESLIELNREFLLLYGNPLMPCVLTKNEFNHPSNPYLIENVKKGIRIMPKQKFMELK